MNRLTATLTVAVALAGVAPPATANYRDCMELCTPGRDFAECHGICSGPTSKPPAVQAAPVTLPKGWKGRDCSTLSLKAAFIGLYIKEDYAPLFDFSLPSLDDPNHINVDFSLTEPYRRCEGTVLLTDDCRLTDAAGKPMNKWRWLNAVSCKSD